MKKLSLLTAIFAILLLTALPGFAQDAVVEIEAGTVAVRVTGEIDFGTVTLTGVEQSVTDTATTAFGIEVDILGNTYENGWLITLVGPASLDGPAGSIPGTNLSLETALTGNITDGDGVSPGDVVFLTNTGGLTGGVVVLEGQDTALGRYTATVTPNENFQLVIPGSIAAGTYRGELTATISEGP